MKTYIINLGLIFFLIIQVSAQTGSTVNDPATGLQFTVPEGWSGQKVEGKIKPPYPIFLSQKKFFNFLYITSYFTTILMDDLNNSIKSVKIRFPMSDQKHGK